MAKIILFNDQNFGGGCKIITDVTPHLGSFNDHTSSVIVIDGTWQLFQDADFSGTVWTVSSTGGPTNDGCYPSYTNWNGKDDSVSSLKPI